MSRQPDKPLISLLLCTTIFIWITHKTCPWLNYGLNYPLAWIPLVSGFLSLSGGLQILGSVLRGINNMVLRLKAYAKSTSKGSAGWATPKVLKKAGLHDTNGMFLGVDETGKPLFHFGTSGHGLVLAPAGSGKTIGFAIPNLLHLDLPIITTDLKGTLAVITKKAREDYFKQPVFCINPGRLFIDILGEPACYNPLIILLDDWMEPHRQKDLISDARGIAIQLLPEPKNPGENAFFRRGSRRLIVFVLIFVVTRDNPEKATLSEALRLLLDPQVLMDAFYVAACSEALHGELANIANGFIKMFEAEDTKRQCQSFLEGALQALEAFSPSGHLADSIRSCDFRFKNLKEKPATIFIIADPTRQAVYQSWLGLLIWCATTELTRCYNNKQVIFLLDEATNFKVEGISTTLTALREFGCHVWFLIQELSEYQRVYGKDALRTMLSQVSVMQILPGVKSQESLEWISKQLGDATIKVENYNLGHTPSDPAIKSVSDAPRRSMTPDEIRQMGHTITFADSLPPIKGRLISYNQAILKEK